MARYEFWTHGVDTVVEFPDRALEIRHAGWGTQVRQAANTENWFHLALPTASIISSQQAVMRDVRIRAEMNENARLDILHVLVDGRVSFSRSLMFTDTAIDEVFQSADTPISGALGVSLHVSFLTGTPVGTVTFRSARVALLTS